MRRETNPPVFLDAIETLMSSQESVHTASAYFTASGSGKSGTGSVLRIAEEENSAHKLESMRHAEVHQGEFTISTDRSLLNVEGVCAFLEQTYWGKARPREMMRKALLNSFCFGLYRPDQQIGFARAITDYATYAYLADVYILEPWRGQGLGRWLIQTILEHPELKLVRRWALITQDAHELYTPLGFRALKNPEHHMELRLPGLKTNP
jgi:GNAT superfamily N-acetyltransferase